MSNLLASTSRVQSDLEGLILDSSEFAALENKLKIFCPFEAVNMVHAEIRHSSFLSSMMDPYRPHGFGIRFLRYLIDNIVKTLSPGNLEISRLELHTADFEDADIRREWNRIDVLVTLNEIKFVIAFELKIHARESKGQLLRYREVVEKQWPSPDWKHLFLLLTPQDREPTDEVWKAITYETIVETIDAFLETDKSGIDMARMMLSAYAGMMRREHMEDAELNEIAAKLWREHREALIFLMENQPDATGGLGEHLKNEAATVGDRASSEEVKIKPDISSNNSTRFYICNWDSYPAMKMGDGWTSTKRLLLIELQTSKQGVYAMLVLGPGNNEIRKSIFDTINTNAKVSGNLAPKYKRLFGTWLVKFKEDDQDFDPDKTFETVTIKLKSFVEENVEPISKAIENSLSENR